MDSDRIPLEDPARFRTQPLHTASRVGSAFVPMLLLALALVAWLGFQAFQQFSERQQLAQLQSSIDVQEQTATKLRSSLDAVATATAQLASNGNTTARVLVEELRKRGVTINPSAPAASAPKAP